MGLSAAAWIAIGAACVAVVALGVCAYLFVQIRRVRANQLVLLGGGKDDLVDFAVSLQARMDDLHGAVSEVAERMTAAHRSLPFGTLVKVTHTHSGRSIVVRINDRGPFVRGRVIDLTPAAAHALGFSDLAPVTIDVIGHS